MKAVHSEYEKNILKDVWRESQLFKSSGLEGNSYTKFNIGSLETLNHENIREELVKFYETHYSANRMNLVILAKEDIETLEKWAFDYFTPVVNHNRLPLVYDKLPFDHTNINTIHKIVPVQNKDKISISWILPNLRPLYKKGPGHYLSHLFGHEGENSLLSLLIDEGLAYELVSGSYDEMNLFTVFYFSIELTREGLQRYEEVLEYCFQYLDILKKKGELNIYI